MGFYSLETSRYKLADRLISNMAGIEMAAIKRGALTEGEWAQAADAAPKIIKHQLELIDASGMTASDIRQTLWPTGTRSSMWTISRSWSRRPGRPTARAGVSHQPDLSADGPWKRHPGGGAVPADTVGKDPRTRAST